MKNQILVLAIFLSLITACGPSAEEQATLTATAQTATAAEYDELIDGGVMKTVKYKR